VNGTIHGLLAVLYPEGCPLCGQALDRACRAGVCSRCLERVVAEPGPRCLRCGTPFGPAWAGEVLLCVGCRLEPPPFDQARPFASFEGETAGALRLLKFGGRPRLSGPLADRILADRETADFLAGAEGLVPVPLHRGRRRRRGYDQARELAAALGRRLRRPLWNVLRRRRPTPPQVGLGAAARRRNLRGAFAPGPHWRRARGRVICLVDDTWTTGATVAAASRAVRNAGPAAVLVFTVARA
jgi:ComF family protein